MGHVNRWIENLESRQLLTAAPTQAVLSGAGDLTVNAMKSLPDGSYVIAGVFRGQIDFQPKGGMSFLAISDDMLRDQFQGEVLPSRSRPAPVLSLPRDPYSG